ncbi:MAG: hypothetical protein ACE5KZ_05390 [Candidatus Scalinduaceae bacterium]
MLKKSYRYISILFLYAICLLYISDANAAKKKIFVCYCGRECECNFEANKFGKCVCGENLFPSDRRPAETLKYECGCGRECVCGSKSDKEGNCVCDKPMKEAKG